MTATANESGASAMLIWKKENSHAQLLKNSFSPHALTCTLTNSLACARTHARTDSLTRCAPAHVLHNASCERTHKARHYRHLARGQCRSHSLLHMTNPLELVWQGGGEGHGATEGEGEGS